MNIIINEKVINIGFQYVGMVSDPWDTLKDEQKQALAQLDHRSIDSFINHLVYSHMKSLAKFGRYFDVVYIDEKLVLIDKKTKKQVKRYYGAWKENPCLKTVLRVNQWPHTDHNMPTIGDIELFVTHWRTLVVSPGNNGMAGAKNLAKRFLAYNSVVVKTMAEPRPHFKIQINGLPFDFYGSINDAKNNKITMADNDLVYAFDCVLSDACMLFSGEDAFYDEFGFDKANRQTWKRLEENQQMYEALSAELSDGDPGNLCDVANALHEQFEELF